ncbi:hypothetical protein Sps_01024 [Shewanella psychrophila]|uniref:Transposase IS200-like domain-containing protein n=1 Tax=Shewanella psychrophila TaxID=225848 RepID=A0A1S6HL26_9GAMM|nr:transposase [Shewanella psychrophila]AQS36213.1 hypothetical protein Sps_01024 [Shewanella psychrophila]
MPTPRKALVSLEDTPYYHCVSRCVRRAYLCGVDHYSGQSYEHRRDWVESRLLELAGVFAVEVCAYTVMGNHLHVVLCIDKEQALAWTDNEVLVQWHKLFKGTLLTQSFVNGDDLNAYELKTVKDSTFEYRQRLMDISWFMRALNEPIARKANFEDNCKGRFWEGRFKSQALLDEAAVLACMAYVDLNPIRAGIAKTPETSDFTSIQQRIKSALVGEQPNHLFPFIDNERKNMPKGLCFSVEEYLKLVDDTGRIIRNDKRGSISESSRHTLHRLNIPEQNWLKITSEFTRLFKGPVGTLQELSRYCDHLERKRRQGAANCHKWLDSA